MAQLAFQGKALALSNVGLAKIASDLGVHAAEVWTLLAVETAGCGYLADRRPQILFERHIFHRLTGGQFDDGEISDPTPGGYGQRGAPQYERLALAISKDRNAALQSASWGIGQIMGMNYGEAGFDSVDDIVAAMTDSEDTQLLAIADFLQSTGLRSFLQAHDWTSFARGYNGPNYAVNRYDVKLNAEFRKYSAGVLPDLAVRAAQLYLTYLGYHPGAIDGIAGEHTMLALTDWQSDAGITQSSVIDDACVAQLCSALSEMSTVAA